MMISTILVLGSIVFSLWVKRLFSKQDSFIRNLTQIASAADEVQRRLNSLERAPFGYMEIDAQGTVRRVNRRECEFRGLKPPQIVDKKYWDLEPIDNREKAREAFLLDIIGDVELVAFRRSLEGNAASVEVSPQHLRGSAGQVMGIQLFSIDVTETVRLEEEKVRRNQKSQALLAAVPDAAFHLNSSGSILEYKPAPHFALRSEGSLGRRLADVLPPGVQELINTNLHFARTSHSERTFEYCFQRDNKPLYCEFRMVPFTWDQMVVLVRDITARKTAQNKAQDYTRELARKNEELTHALMQAQELKKTKAEFIQNVSLELRTPMSGIVGMTAKLLDTELDGEQRPIVEAVRTSSAVVLSALNNVLDTSRLESEVLPLTIRPFGVRDVIQKVVWLLSSEASKKGLSLEWGVAREIPVMIQGDPVRLEKVLVNLVENGISFTSHGQVSLGVGLVAETEENWTLKFAVQDTGIGISSSRLPTLFDSHTLANGGDSRPKGSSGLGLAICKQLVGMMAGKITAESSPGKGSIFGFTAVFEKCASNPSSVSAPGVSN